ncbi:MAG: hypothetical protein H5T85_07645, partial [Actinobacteria bacterium]|nr:hypothetical protein [Actinomycetota bacterium]
KEAGEESIGKATGIKSEEMFLELRSKQNSKNPLNDINVRKAIFHAIDRERIVKELLGEYGSVLNSLFRQDSIYYYPSWEEYFYDLSKAQEYLKMAGYGPENPLYLTIGSNDESSSRKIIEELIKEDLDRIGIKVWIFNKPSEEWYNSFVSKGSYDLGVWALYTLDGSELECYFSSQKMPSMETVENKNCRNFYWYNNKEVDSILRELSGETKKDRRIDLVCELQEKLAGDAIILPLFSRVYCIAYNKRLENLDIDLTDGNYLTGAENWKLSGSERLVENEERSEERTGGYQSKEVVVGYEEEPYVLNPFVTDDLYTSYINSLVVAGLWKMDKNGEYLPVLVDNTWDKAISEESVKHTLKASVKLRDDVFWEDGTPVTSEDVRYTWLSVLEDESLLNSLGYRDLVKKIKDIEVIDKKQFNIIFTDYFREWKKLFRFIFPKSKIEGKRIGYLFRNDIFGCGPYKLKEWVRGEYLLLEKNQYYFGKEPSIDYIRFLFNSDENSLITLLEDGEIDILNVPPDSELLSELDENKNIDILVKQGNLWEHLAICLKPEE